MVTRITRLVPLGFLLVGPSEGLSILGDNKWLGNLQHLISGAFMKIMCDMLKRAQQHWVTYSQVYQPKWWSCGTCLNGILPHGSK
jgi:hypothetical protein